MGLAYAPIDDEPPDRRPPLYKKEPIQKPIVDNTECNYIILWFLGGFILMNIMDSLRK
jgi:hypothetical protein